jgi:4-carboxymuconolactone decarboxylase
VSTQGPTRIPPVDPAALTPEQQDVFDRIAGTRGRVAGPFTVLLHVPALANRVQHLGAYLRYEATLDRDVAETAVLVTAQRRSSPFEWEAHEPLARRAGVPDDVLDALKVGAATTSMPSRFRAIVDYARELADSGSASDASYAAALAIVGRESMVELTVLVGYYSLLAMTLAAHDLDSPWA